MKPFQLSRGDCVALAFPELTGAASLRVYFALRLHGKKACPSLLTLSSALGLTPRTVDKALEQLVAARLIAPAGDRRKGVVTAWRFLDWTDERLAQLALVLDFEKKSDRGLYCVASLVPGNDRQYDIPTRGRRRADAWWNARLDFPREETERIFEAAFRECPKLKDWANGEGADQMRDFKKRYPPYLVARGCARLAGADISNVSNPAAYLQTILSEIEGEADPAVEGVWQEDPLEPPKRARAGKGGRRRDKSKDNQQSLASPNQGDLDEAGVGQDTSENAADILESEGSPSLNLFFEDSRTCQ